jgi:hypothetical protein
LACIALTACARTWIDYQPYSTQTSAQAKVVNYTLVAFEGDIEALARAGGFVVGTIQVRGNGYAGEDDIASRARLEAANYGGTHIILAGKGSSVSLAKITPDRAHTSGTVSGNTYNATTTYQPGVSVPVTRHRAGYVVVRVPVDHWRDLPAALRPAYGRHYDNPAFAGTQRPVERTVRGAPGSDSRERGTTPSDGIADDAWSCTRAPNGNGICFRREAGCRQARAQLADHGYSSCIGQSFALCFVYERNDERGLSCHPDRVACRLQRDFHFSRGDSLIRACERNQ